MAELSFDFRAKATISPPAILIQSHPGFELTHSCVSSTVMSMRQSFNQGRITTAFGFSLMELMVVFTITAVLSIALVGFAGSAIAKSRNLRCQKNMRQIGIASMQYASDNNYQLPASSHQRRQGQRSWTLSLSEYLGGSECFLCPSEENKKRRYSYVLNDLLTLAPAGAPKLNFSQLPKIPEFSRTLLFAEAADTYLNSDHFHFSDYYGKIMTMEVFANQVAVEKHRGCSNYLFVDGHVECLSTEQVQERLSNTRDPFLAPPP